MARIVHCKKLDKDLPGLERPPYKSDLGKRIFEEVSQEAWERSSTPRHSWSVCGSGSNAWEQALFSAVRLRGLGGGDLVWLPGGV